MQYITMQLPGLPLQVSFYQNGQVAFARAHNAPVIIDQPEQGLSALISPTDIFIGNNSEIKYGVRYNLNDEPNLKEWLQAQNIETPVFG